MRTTALLLASLAAVLVFAAAQEPKPAEPRGAEAKAQLERLSWLAGTWVMQDGGATTEEHWRPLQGTTMLGTSHSYDSKRTHFFEFLRVTIRKNEVVYIAMPGGGAATTFTLTTIDDGVVEFENAAHDHPQRIRYEKTKAGVTATIGQLDGSRAMKFEFTAK